MAYEVNTTLGWQAKAGSQYNASPRIVLHQPHVHASHNARIESNPIHVFPCVTSHSCISWHNIGWKCTIFMNRKLDTRQEQSSKTNKHNINKIVWFMFTKMQVSRNAKEQLEYK